MQKLLKTFISWMLQKLFMHEKQIGKLTRNQE